MANEKHLSIIELGAEVWNEWWEENEDVTPDLRGANLSGAIQSDIDITDNDEAIVTVDNLEIAQFIYLLMVQPL